MNQAVYDAKGTKMCGNEELPETLTQQQLMLRMPVYQEGYLYTKLPDGEICVIETSENAANLLLATPEKQAGWTLETFYIEMLKGNLSSKEIMDQLKRFHKKYDTAQTVIVLGVQHCSAEDARSIFDMVFQNSDSVTVRMSPVEYAVVMESSEEDEIKELCCAIRDSFLNEMQAEISIGIGESVVNMQGLAFSYDQACSALKIGESLQYDGGVWRYKDILPELLLSYLPREALKHQSLLLQKIENVLDYDTQTLLGEFFKQNLNISQTAKSLYMHRNTLIYRLEKLNKATGMNVSNFEDAVILRLFVALARLNNKF